MERLLMFVSASTTMGAVYLALWGIFFGIDSLSVAGSILGALFAVAAVSSGIIVKKLLRAKLAQTLKS